ncbi:MAG: zf-HC2 domain-containing protein [Nitriliruptoraceae bacterium]
MMRVRRRPPRSVSAEPDCHEVATVLQSYLDGELPTQDAGRVATHLEHCQRCDIEATTVRKVIDAIQRQRPELDAGTYARLTGVIDELVGPDETEEPAG